MRIIDKMLLCALLLPGAIRAQQQTITLTVDQPNSSLKVNPLNWFTGMEDSSVQLMVYAAGLGKMTPVLKHYPGVSIAATHKVENPNYLFVDLIIEKSAKPGMLHFTFEGNGKHHNLDYILREKNPEDGSSRILGVTDKDFVYMLMPDRFANGDPSNDVVKGMRDTTVAVDSLNYRHGGDLKGVEEHLDYIKDLGANTVWLTPVNTNDMPLGGREFKFSSYHGYAMTDQYEVDPRFGGNAAYASVAKAIHKRGMKLIQDAVYNHIGSYHWTMLDMPMKDWVNQWPEYTNTSYKVDPLVDPYSSQIDRRTTVEGWFVKTMPDLNQKNPYVRHYLIQYAIWATETYGVDGWRVDTWFYSDKDFLNMVNSALEREFPRITMFGEVWVGNVAEAAYFCQNNLNVPYKPNLQGVVDFNVCFAMQAALRDSNGAEKLYTTLAQDFLYKNPKRNCIMLDNHDMDRVFSVMGEDLNKYRMGITWLLTLRGIPQLYYGTEILMTGTKPGSDGHLRMDFPGGWPGDSTNKFLAGGRTAREDSAFRFVRTLAHYRSRTSALTTGKLMQYMPWGGLYVYFRYDEYHTVMVVSNAGHEASTLHMDRYSERAAPFRHGRDVVTGETVTLEGLPMGVYESRVLELMP
jgi:glycosidase